MSKSYISSFLFLVSFRLQFEKSTLCQLFVVNIHLVFLVAEKLKIP